MSDFETRIESKIDRIMAKLGIAEPPTPVTPVTPGANVPGDVLDLKRWKLTLPVKGGDGKVKEIPASDLTTFKDSKFFFVNAEKTGVVFRTFHGGFTTPGSKNPRTELREMAGSGSEKAAWKGGSGTHTMSLTGQVNRLTRVKPHLVIAQIHGKEDDMTVFRVEGKKLWITDGDDPHGHLVTDDFRLGTRYSLKIEVSGGKTSYWYNGDKIDFTLPNDDSGNYFKAGSYLQSNPESASGESNDEFAEAVIFELTVSHSG
jgi:hypothetical protein